jgi:hypothetical protein
MAKAFSYDLGVFDPTFPGITLHFPNEATWKQVSSYTGLVFNAAASDMLQKDPKLSPSDLTTGQVLKHMSVDLNFNSPLEEADKESLGRSLIDADPDEAVGYLAVTSSHIHERRHFHDWILSPYAAAISAMRVEVFMNYAQLRGALRAGGTTAIPVPITRWMRKTPSEQKELLEMWQALLGDAVVLRLPELTDPDVLACIEGIERRYKSIGMLFEPVYGFDLDAASLFEASALLIQTQAIHDSLGETAHMLFLNSMADQGPKSRYTWFIRALSGLRRPDEILEVDTLTALATWCLLGSADSDLPNSNPLTRMFHVVKYVKEHGFPKVDTPSHAIFAEIEGACGAVSYVDVLNRSVQLGDSIVEWLEKAVAEDHSGSNFAAGVAQAYTYLQQCHKYMAGLFLNDPDGYAKPAGYLDRNLEKWPEPAVRYTFGQPFFRVKRANLGKYQRSTLFESESTAEDAVLRQYIDPFPEDLMQVRKICFDIQVADNWQYLCGLVDTMFAEYNRDQPEIDYQRERARKDGLYLLEVLN